MSADKKDSEINTLKKLVARDRILGNLTRLLCEFNSEDAKCYCTCCTEEGGFGNCLTVGDTEPPEEEREEEQPTICALFERLQAECRKWKLPVPGKVDCPTTYHPNIGEVSLENPLQMGECLLAPTKDGKIHFPHDVTECKEVRWIEKLDA